jgi:hypothetical protein
MLFEQRPACNDRGQHISKFDHMVGRMAMELEIGKKPYFVTS